MLLFYGNSNSTPCVILLEKNITGAQVELAISLVYLRMTEAARETDDLQHIQAERGKSKWGFDDA